MVEHRRHARRRPRDRAHDGDEPAGRARRAKGRCTSSTSAAATTTTSCAPPTGWRIAKRVETTLWFEGSLPPRAAACRPRFRAFEQEARRCRRRSPGASSGRDGQRAARVVGERRRRALRVRVVGAAHVEVAGLADEAAGQLVRERRHAHLARGSTRSAACASATSGRPLSLVVKSEPPSSIIRNIGTQIAVSSTMPMRRSGMRSSVPLRMRSVHASAAAVQRKTDSSGGRTKSSGCGVPRVVERAALVGDVEHRRHAVVDERAPDRVVIGMRERAAVDERGRDHREVHAVALEPCELGARASRASRSVHVRDRVHLARGRRSRPTRTSGSTRSCSR